MGGGRRHCFNRGRRVPRCNKGGSFSEAVTLNKKYLYIPAEIVGRKKNASGACEPPIEDDSDVNKHRVSE